MSRHAKLLVVAALAGGLFYGRFALPELLTVDNRGEVLLELRDENERLRCQNEELKASNTRLLTMLVPRQLGSTRSRYSDSLVEQLRERTGSFAPDEDLSGWIKDANSECALVTIDLGSDSGLERGHTLGVYRITIIGTLRVVEVRPNEAVATFINGGEDVQVGDQVFSTAPANDK